MSRDFLGKFGQMQENDIGSFPKQENNKLYAATGGSRNLCFASLEGRLVYFNYAYLITAEYNPDKSHILIEFTTHKVAINGFGLEPLYYQLFDQTARVIECQDERYKEISGGGPIVVEITITANS